MFSNDSIGPHTIQVLMDLSRSMDKGQSIGQTIEPYALQILMKLSGMKQICRLDDVL